LWSTVRSRGRSPPNCTLKFRGLRSSPRSTRVAS
jgi:hypothetical protein